jgi:hypothetical protein
LSVFGPLKTYLGAELDRIFRHSTSRIARVEFTAAYIQARERAFRPHSIQSGFRKAGIYPFNPNIILDNLTPPPGTPPSGHTTESQEVNLSQTLLEDPQEGTPTPLDPDALYTQIVTDENLATPKRAFIKGLLGLAVRKQAESSLLRKDLREKEVLLDTRRTRKSGKRVILKDQIIVSRESIQREVEKIDNQTSVKKKKKGKQRAEVVVVSSEDEETDTADELA